MDGSHRLANLYIQQLGPLRLWYSGNSDHHGYAKSPKLSKFYIFHNLGLWLLLWRSLNFPSLHCSSVATSDMIICGQGFRSEIYWNFNYSPRKLLRMSNACSYVIVGRGCFSGNTQFTPAFLYTHAELQFLKSLASPRVCRTSAEANTRHTLPPCLSKTTMIISHASDLSKLTTATCNGYYQAASRCCSMSSGLEKGQKHGWKPFFCWLHTLQPSPSNPEMCVFHRFPVSRAFLDNFWHYPESTLVPVCIQISKYDYFRNPHGTCAKTDWTLWHEKFRVPLEPGRNRESTRSDHQQIAGIRQCGTRFWVHDQEQF
jgi:hypothetical protein